LFRYRNLVFPVVFVPLLVLTQPRPFGGSWRIDAWIDAFGLMVAAGGQLLRVLVIGLAYIRRGGKEGRIYADTLVQEGLFAHSRNPLYLGNLIAIAGMLIVHGNPLATVIAAPLFLAAYLSITAAEEHFLANRFGESYLDYCRRVPRFLPRLTGLRATMRGMRFDWRKVIRKEYGTLYSTATVGLLLIARERILEQGGLHWSKSLETIAVLWLCTNVLYIAARVLKKKRLLGAD
jgi:protein-S-isoprenylcysteine O-methyltransferase Ste14